MTLTLHHGAGSTLARMVQTLLIGQVAKRTGIGVGAVRLYERLKLIPAPSRSRAGYRHYPEDTVLRVQVIRAAKMLGFTLREMVQFFAGMGADGMSGAARDAILESKLQEIDGRIRSLGHMRTLLLRLKSAPGRASTRAECALAEAALNIVREMERKPVRRRGGTIK